MTAETYWMEKYNRKTRCPRKRLMLATMIVLLSISEIHHAELVLKERKKENGFQFLQESSALLAVPESDGYVHKVRIWKYILSKTHKPIASIEALGVAACCVDSGARHGVSPYLIASVLRTESCFSAAVINEKNCWGMAQIRPFDNEGKDVWFNELVREGIITRVEDLLRPENNIEACAYILAKYRDLYKRPYLVLSRYSGSESNPWYYSEVMNNLREFQEGFL